MNTYAVMTALRETAQAEGLGSIQLAVLAGVTQVAAQNWLTGKSGISAASCIRLVHALPGFASRLDLASIKEAA